MAVVVNFCRLSSFPCSTQAQLSDWSRVQNEDLVTWPSTQSLRIRLARWWSLIKNRSLWGQCLKDFLTPRQDESNRSFCSFLLWEMPFCTMDLLLYYRPNILKETHRPGFNQTRILSYYLETGLWLRSETWKRKRSYTKEIMISQVLSKSGLGRYINLSRVVSDHRPEGSL